MRNIIFITKIVYIYMVLFILKEKPKINITLIKNLRVVLTDRTNLT